MKRLLFASSQHQQGQAPILGRPFKLSTHEALDHFQTWSRLALCFKVTHIRQVNPILLPFYSYTNRETGKFRVLYAGSRFSDQFVSAAKTNPDFWLEFDKQKTAQVEDLDTETAWCKTWEEADLERESANEILKAAYLPAYEVRFMRASQNYSAIVGAETGRVSGLKLVSFQQSLNAFLRFLLPFFPPRTGKLVCVCLPPIGLAALAWTTFQTMFLPKFALELSKFTSLRLVAAQFREYDPSNAEMLTGEEEDETYREYFKQKQLEEEQIRQERRLDATKAEEAYAVLGLSDKRGGDLQLSDFRQAYREQLLRYHPDHFPGDPKLARKRTQEVIEAFRLLTGKNM